MKDGEKTNLFLHTSIRKKLETLAAEDRRSMTTYVEKLIEEAYAARTLQESPEKTLPFPSAGRATSPVRYGRGRKKRSSGS